MLFFRHLDCHFLFLPSSAVAGRSHCNRGSGGSAWKDMARPARQHHAVCTLTPVDPSTWVSGTWSHVEQPPAKHKVWVKAIQNWTGFISNETLWSWIHSNDTLTTCQAVPQCPSLLEQSGDLRWKQKKSKNKWVMLQFETELQPCDVSRTRDDEPRRLGGEQERTPPQRDPERCDGALRDAKIYRWDDRCSRSFLAVWESFFWMSWY